MIDDFLSQMIPVQETFQETIQGEGMRSLQNDTEKEFNPSGGDPNSDLAFLNISISQDTLSRLISIKKGLYLDENLEQSVLWGRVIENILNKFDG